MPVERYIIMRNGTYGALRRFSRQMGVVDAPGLDIPDMDFCALAKGYGVPAMHAATATALDEALREAFAAGGPWLIEVPTLITEY